MKKKLIFVCLVLSNTFSALPANAAINIASVAITVVPASTTKSCTIPSGQSSCSVSLGTPLSAGSQIYVTYKGYKYGPFYPSSSVISGVGRSMLSPDFDTCNPSDFVNFMQANVGSSTISYTQTPGCLLMMKTGPQYEETQTVTFEISQ